MSLLDFARALFAPREDATDEVLEAAAEVGERAAYASFLALISEAPARLNARRAARLNHMDAEGIPLEVLYA